MQALRSTVAGGRRGHGRRIAVLLLSGLALCIMPAAGPLAQTMQPEHVRSADPYAAHIAEASQRFGIPAGWIRAVLAAESAGDSTAVSSAGAMGLMQVMPETWATLRVRHRLGNDPFDPRANILAGTAYLREMLDRYGDIAAMLASYNAGPARYDVYRTSGGILPAETRAYVALLAPVLGGAPLPGSGLVPLRSADWREAPLFAGSMAIGPTAPQLTSDGIPDGAVDPPVAPAGTTAPSPLPELFVARSSGDLAR